MSVRAIVHACFCARARVFGCARACVPAYLGARVWMLVRLRAYVCVCVCVRAHAGACVSMSVCVRVRPL